MANEQNLIPFTKLTEKEQRELARKGGKASGKARREKKSMRESLEVILGMALKPGKAQDVEQIKNFTEIKGKNITVEQAMLIAQVQKALKGDTQALAFLRDTSGQKPDDNVNLTGAVPVVISGEDKLED